MAQPSREAKARYREKHREKIRAKARVYDERRRREMGLFKRGTPESSERLSKARKASGLEHGMWKGDDVGMVALHGWVKRRMKKTGVCSECGDRRITDWANISGEYLRDLADWREMCRSCHKRYDLKKARGVI